MKTFESRDKVHVPGRGLIFIVHIPNPNCERRSPGLPEAGEVVLIDGEERVVRAVEAFMKLMSPPYMSEDVGLLVNDVCTICGSTGNCNSGGI